MLSARCSAPDARLPRGGGAVLAVDSVPRLPSGAVSARRMAIWRYGASSLPTWAPMWADRRSALVKVSSVNAAGSVFASAVNSTGDWAPHTARQRPGSTANLPTPSDS
jgi:hypothetical protein